MGFFDSESNTSNTTNNINQDTNLNLIDYSEDGAGSITGASAHGGSTVSITNSDQGAISGAFDFAMASLDYGGQQFDQAVSLVGNSTAASVKAVQESSKQASERTLSQFMKVGGLIAVSLGAIVLLKKVK